LEWKRKRKLSAFSGKRWRHRHPSSSELRYARSAFEAPG
jgi:hypothetical protein